MTIYIYGDAATKKISTITKQQQFGLSGVEVQVADNHLIAEDPDAYNNYRLNAASTGVELVPNPVRRTRRGKIERAELVEDMLSVVLTDMQTVLSATHTPQAIIVLYRSFSLEHHIAREEYIETGNPLFRTNVGLPSVTHDIWLNANPGTGITIRAFIIARLS